MFIQVCATPTSDVTFLHIAAWTEPHHQRVSAVACASMKTHHSVFTFWTELSWSTIGHARFSNNHKPSGLILRRLWVLQSCNHLFLVKLNSFLYIMTVFSFTLCDFVLFSNNLIILNYSIQNLTVKMEDPYFWQLVTTTFTCWSLSKCIIIIIFKIVLIMIY